MSSPKLLFTDLINFLKKKAKINQKQERKDSDDDESQDQEYEHAACDGHDHHQEENNILIEEHADEKDGSEEREIVMEDVEGLEGGENEADSDDAEESDG